MDPEYVQWLRPKEIKDCQSPVLFSDGVSPGDIIQGALVAHFMLKVGCVGCNVRDGCRATVGF
jgi:hypothetical protein